MHALEEKDRFQDTIDVIQLVDGPNIWRRKPKIAAFAVFQDCSVN